MKKILVSILGFYLMATSISAQIIKTKDETLRGPFKSITWSTYSLWQYNGEYRKYKLERQSISHYDREGYEVLKLYGSQDSTQTRKMIYNWDSKGKLIEELFYNGDSLSYSNVFQYDEAGNLLSISEIRTGIQMEDTQVFEYNEAGKLIGKTYYIMNKTGILSRWGYAYNKDGNRIATGYDFYGRKSSTKSFTGYDPKGNVVCEANIKADGTFVPYDYYTYDELGQKTQHDQYWDGKLKSKTSYQYDSLGNNTTIRVVDSTGKVTTNKQYLYTYDQHQNWISRIEITGGYHRKILERAIEYYE